MKKYLIGFAIAAVALPVIWAGSQAYNDYRMRNCTPTDLPPESQVDGETTNAKTAEITLPPKL